jgi:hypothetical protein
VKAKMAVMRDVFEETGVYEHLCGPMQQVSGKGDAEAPAEEDAVNCDVEGEGEGESESEDEGEDKGEGEDDGEGEGEDDGEGADDEQPPLMVVLRLVAHPALPTLVLGQEKEEQVRNELKSLPTSKS